MTNFVEWKRKFIWEDKEYLYRTDPSDFVEVEGGEYFERDPQGHRVSTNTHRILRKIEKGVGNRWVGHKWEPYPNMVLVGRGFYPKNKDTEDDDTILRKYKECKEYMLSYYKECKEDCLEPDELFGRWDSQRGLDFTYSYGSIRNWCEYSFAFVVFEGRPSVARSELREADINLMCNIERAGLLTKFVVVRPPNSKSHNPIDTMGTRRAGKYRGGIYPLIKK